MNEQYRVYANAVLKKAVIHRDECGSCNHGNGVHRGKGKANSCWLPVPKLPPLSFDKAKAVAKATGFEVSECGHCLRH
jgi:hypothetical protein